ncbi:hypothetical protein [uncultured Pseudomonas sp.]|uniref:hypothetical protein n=1 Tax=uncultured Pseudomonas sp. TaxID=114707 RepID=UPI0025E32DE0|nr:hypothetical protein [uncultured Pseudomonas sp.]
MSVLATISSITETVSAVKQLMSLFGVNSLADLLVQAQKLVAEVKELEATVKGEHPAS